MDTEGYWFCSYCERHPAMTEGAIYGTVLDAHPFKQIKWWQEKSNKSLNVKRVYSIISFQEITKEEYDLFLKS